MKKSDGEVIADSEEEFSSQQGDDGWSYGYFVAPAPGGPYDPAAWQPMPEYRTTIWGYEWVGKQKHLVLKPSNAHPALEGDNPVWAVRRWTSDVAGSVRLEGQCSRTGKGDGATARVFVDGQEIWKRQLGGGHATLAEFELTVPVVVGTLVDLAIDPGPGIDTSYDATSSRFTVRHLP
jgi:hypothetical protein